MPAVVGGEFCFAGYFGDVFPNADCSFCCLFFDGIEWIRHFCDEGVMQFEVKAFDCLCVWIDILDNGGRFTRVERAARPD